MGRGKALVVGAGPAGMMAAIRLGELKQDVTLIEKNPSPGKKILLSGKGRCNLTNICDLDSFLKKFSHNGEFLRDAFKKFFNTDLIRFFEERGLKLKAERQGRVFPVTDVSKSVLDILERELKDNNVTILYRTGLKDIFVKDRAVKGVLLNNGKAVPADKVILATGGVSYPSCGSTGEGIGIARALGHAVVPLKPGLVPLEAREKFVRRLKGLALKNIRLKFSDSNSQILSDIGELLFTDFGISGPLVLSLSSKVADWLSKSRAVNVEIDLKPALSKEQLNARLLREFKASAKKTLKNTLKALLPLNFVDVFLEVAGLIPDKKAGQVTSQERRVLVSLLKAFRLHILRTRPIEDAMVTCGGISLKEINPRTMESRRIRGLYFAGEMIDIDADTGGFNLQAAFSTGYLAGESAAI
ncbi:MAG: NAD(P)/FAD-dependent oxidoreductase [Candidatus Omnitrophota bacterium]